MKHLLIVGPAATGKTRLIRELARRLRGAPIDGWYTEALRDEDHRLGWWLSSLDGRQALLGHRLPEGSEHLEGSDVNLAVVDEVALGILQRAQSHALALLIDEVGPTLLSSLALQHALAEALDHGPRLVMTAGMSHLPYLEALKRRTNVELIPLTAGNRSAVLEELTARLEALCDEDERVRQLQRQADQICELIVGSDVPQIDIEIQQTKLREMVAQQFPDKQSLYSLVYDTRFKRLWQQFRQS